MWIEQFTAEQEQGFCSGGQQYLSSNLLDKGECNRYLVYIVQEVVHSYQGTEFALLD